VLTFTPGITSYTENGAPVAIDPGALFDKTGTFNGNSLVISLSNVSADNRLGILKGSTTAGISIDGEAVLYNGVKIGTSHRTGLGVNAAQEASTFVITFDAQNPAPAITATIVQALLRSLNISNSSETLPPTTGGTPSGVVSVQLKNGTTIVEQAQKSIRFDGVNDAPTIGRYYQLYDASTGLRPDQAGSAGITTLAPSTGTWFSFQNSAAAPLSQGTVTSNAVANGNLNLAVNTPAFAGYSNYQVNVPSLSDLLRSAPITTNVLNTNTPVLDRIQGYTFSFTGQVLSESRDAGSDKNGDGKDDRGGFVVTLNGNDKKGIELEFWTNRIWARDDGTTQIDPSIQAEPGTTDRTLFAQAEYVDISNNGGDHTYDITLKGNSYTVYVDGVAKLSGRIRDYVASGQVRVGPLNTLTPNVYDQPNLIFFGDKNPNAQSSVSISKVSLTTNETFTGNFATRSMVEDGTIVLRDIAIGDAEAQLTDVLVTLTGAVGSQIQITPTAGVTIGSTPNGSVTLTGAPGKINTALLAGISYRPPANANGTQSLEIKINDRGQGGAPLETVKSIAFNISSVADAPILSGNSFLDSRKPATLSDLFAGKLSDADVLVPSSASVAGYAIVSDPDPTKGTWEYKGANDANWTAIAAQGLNQVLTLSPTTQLRFTPGANGAGTEPSLTVRAIDSTIAVTNGATITPNTNDLALYSVGRSIVAGRTAAPPASIVFRTLNPDGSPNPNCRNFTSTKTGAEANETIYGSRADDIINGGEGDDWIGGGGNDFLVQLSGRFLWDRDGNDQFDGGDGNDQLYGYAGNDSLKGGIGDDRLEGGRGNDILTGGTGLDTLIGGAGIDAFVVQSLADGLDTVLDFEVGTDLIDLRGIFSGLTLSPFALFKEFVTIEQVGNDSLIVIDNYGNGSGITKTTLLSLFNVTASTLTSESFITANLP
jgi:hypothetical protein